ncbi:MAG: YhcH/YjgK/YiaL family protein [Clostridium sp.]|nr:YhcH/YjgK/YiaL family protein [Clostridium sp.]
MIIDTLDNLGKYTQLNDLFDDVEDYLHTHCLEDLPLGQIVLKENELWVNVVETGVKSREEAKVETHDQMIDIQIPLTATEEMGWCPRTALPQVPYNETDDISFYAEKPITYFPVSPGMFVVFFPEDGHAPAITATALKKIIIKVRAKV